MVPGRDHAAEDVRPRRMIGTHDVRPVRVRTRSAHTVCEDNLTRDQIIVVVHNVNAAAASTTNNRSAKCNHTNEPCCNIATPIVKRLSYH